MPRLRLPNLLSPRRLAPFLVGAGLLLGFTVVIGVGRLPFGGRATALAGTSLGEQRAPDFRLTDATGAPVSLASLRGKAVALTFIYTSCPDICPLTAEKFREVHDQLGIDANRVALVAITVDPETDTPQRIAQYSQEMNLDGKWSFLTGSRTELAPVWSSYYVEPLTTEQALEIVSQGTGTAKANPAFQAAHSLAVYVIDPQGRERSLLGPDFAPADLTHDLRVLTTGA